MTETSDVLPAIYTNVAGEVIARVIGEFYDIGPVVRCQLLIRGNNDVYAFRTAEGGRYVARLSHLRVRGPSNAAYETALLAFLRAAGAPVAAAIPARDGRLWRLLKAWEGERAFTVFEHLLGRPAGIDPADAAAQGAALAQIHREAAAFDGERSLYRNDLDSILREPMRRLRDVPYLKADLRARIDAVAGRVEARLAPLLSELDWRACHGDPLSVNAHVRVLEDGSLTAAYFDFENAGPSWVAHDLAMYFERIARRGAVGAFDDGQRLQWSAFVQGYERVRRIGAQDYAAIAAFAPVRRLYWPADFAGRIHEWGSSNLQPTWIETHLDAAERWLDVEMPPLSEGD
jgi:Ser/Thr protein kinase RdoA (MazF antagonist)